MCCVGIYLRASWLRLVDRSRDSGARPFRLVAQGSFFAGFLAVWRGVLALSLKICGGRGVCVAFSIETGHLAADVGHGGNDFRRDAQAAAALVSSHGVRRAWRLRENPAYLRQCGRGCPDPGNEPDRGDECHLQRHRGCVHGGFVLPDIDYRASRSGNRRGSGNNSQRNAP